MCDLPQLIKQQRNFIYAYEKCVLFQMQYVNAELSWVTHFVTWRKSTHFSYAYTISIVATQSWLKISELVFKGAFVPLYARTRKKTH